MGDIRYIESHGASIAYQVMGGGEFDLVIVPPIISHLDAALELPGYHALLERLGSFARLVIFDKRGSGLSDRRGGAPSLEIRMDDLRAVMDAAGSQRAALLGVSEGGPMSVLFAATYPQRVSHLMLWGTFARFLRADDYPHMYEHEQHAAMVERMVSRWGFGVSMDLFAPSFAGDSEHREAFARFERSAVSPSGLRELWQLVEEIDVRHVLSSVRAPTLVCHRRDDAVVPLDAGRYVAEHIAGSRFAELKGRDHLPYFGDQSPIADEVAAFLTGERATGQDATRVLATVLFTDIVDSTKTATDLGDDAWRKLLDAHDAVAARVIKTHRGKLVKSTGDGVLATFDGPGRAIRCGRELTKSLSELDIAIRVGLHTGEIERRGDDVGGIAVHVAARVQSKAEPGEVLVSRTVTDLVAGSGLRFVPRGEHALKGVAGEWALFAVTH